MKKSIVRVKNGLKINLKGEAEKIVSPFGLSQYHSVAPLEFHYFVPKVLVKEGDEVKVGTPLIYDKKNHGVKIVSPVAGKISEIKRGAKRKLELIKIETSENQEHEPLKLPKDFTKSTRKTLVEALVESGLWAFIRQRPYNHIANPTETPKAIFVSGFDTNPLGADVDVLVNNRADDFQKGIEVLNALCQGKIYLNISTKTYAEKELLNVKNVIYNTFEHKHPAGNIGFQIQKILPLNKGEIVWHIHAQDVCCIGNTFLHGKLHFSKIIAISGGAVENPQYYRTTLGTSVQELLEKKLKSQKDIRVITGSILSGRKIETDGTLGFYDNNICVISDERKLSLLAWLMPNLNKFSTSGSYFSWLTPLKKYDLSTSMNGEERAFVVTGRYESVVGMDIYPMQLLKSIIINDIEAMEHLGIYEVVEEDLATCEFVCTSKIRVQEILRKGLDSVRKEYLVEE